jgi:hypothetical protein
MHSLGCLSTVGRVTRRKYPFRILAGDRLCLWQASRGSRPVCGSVGAIWDSVLTSRRLSGKNDGKI